MDEEPPRKRVTPARDSLDILRRVEPVLMRVASDVVSLRQGAVDLAAAVGGRGDAGDRAIMADGVQRLSQEAGRLAETHEKLRRMLEEVREGQHRLTESQDRLGLDQERLAQGWARQEDGQDRLVTGQATLLDGVERVREELAGHDSEARTGHETVAAHLQRLREAQSRMAEDQGLMFEAQQTLSGMITRLDERLTRQSRELGALRRELRFLPVLWSLAALVFVVAGAMVVVLRVRLY